MKLKFIERLACCVALASLAACGGSGSDSMVNPSPPTPQNAPLSLLLSDAPTQDWALIGVKVLSISLTPESGGAPVTVYSAPSSAPSVNLVQLDQINELLGNVSIPSDTYASATITISANPGDVELTASAEPDTGFAGAAGATIPANQIQIQGASGSSGALTVPVNVKFASPLVVSTTQNNALDLEVDLAHPAFIIAHVPPAAGTTLWAVDFRAPVRHRPIKDVTRLVLRHMYGNVTAVASDDSSITITRDFPTLPIVNPETAVATQQSLQILADATNGTIFYDLDAKTTTTIKDFSSVASGLVGKYVRVAARYQQNGTLVGVRIWASSQFNNVWVSPEGHVFHVNTTTDVIWVFNEAGGAVPLSVNANTQFYFRVPQNALADATPIGTGPAFLANHNLVRGFKVHASVVDPLGVPLVAQTIDIETAAYQGTISAADNTTFTYTRNFLTASDDYTYTLPYISDTTTNEVNGVSTTGFVWWNLGYPTLMDTGSAAVGDFVSATNGGVNFGGTVGNVTAWGVSGCSWNDPIDADSWAARWTVLLPTPLPLGTVATGFANGTFTMNVVGGTQPATVDVSTASGSATLAYQIDRSGGVITVSPEDLTTTAGLNAFTAGVQSGAIVKVYGVPQSGSLKAYVILYYTGDMPAS